MTIPLRIQRRRTAGWRSPPNTRYVGRTGKGYGQGTFGNPIRPGMWKGYTAAQAVVDYLRWVDCDPSVRSYDNAFGKPPTREQIIAELAGKNLSCWCKLCSKHESGKPLNEVCPDCAPCHVDPLGMIANGFRCEAA